MSGRDEVLFVSELTCDTVDVTRFGDKYRQVLPGATTVHLRRSDISVSFETDDPKSWRIGDKVRVRVERVEP